MTAERARRPWFFLLRPRWLAWHAFAVVATVGMLYLGDWQLRRAESGNELSWAYTFEWPLFAAFGVYFWIKSLRDELRQRADVEADSDTATSATARAAAVGPRAASCSWDATSWDATSRNGSSRAAGVAGADAPVDVARATPADGEAYLARLKAEVRRTGRRHGWR